MCCRRLALRLVAVAALLATHTAVADDVDLEIPEQQLSSALMIFARQASVSVGFPTDITDNIRSTPLSGRYRPEDALEILLDGTGLNFTFYAPGVFRIHQRIDSPAGESVADTDSRDADSESPRSPIRERRIEEIIAVGTRLRSYREDMHLPLSVIDSARIHSTGPRSVGEVLAMMPAQGVNAFNGIDNYFYGVNDARGDVSSANLRELGSGNTLMLLNGRRIVSHPGFQVEGQVIAMTENSNAMPLYAIDRIEILRDGASSIHGSDAVAGIVNTVVENTPDIFTLGAHQGLSEDSAFGYTALDLRIGRAIGDHSTVSLFVDYAHSNAMPATDRPFSASSDMRPLFVGTGFDGDGDLDNRAGSSAWGQFLLPEAVSAGGVPVTSDTGLFHIQPADFPGCTANLPGNICIDDAILDPALRFNNNAYRFLVPSITRTNVFTMLSTELGDYSELYGEAGWYSARTHHTREPANPLSSHPITIPASNYWNPFGPTVFADGRVNPNRLPGIDAPPEGLPVLINTRVQGGLHRIVDAGAREIDVENTSYRVLAGIRGSGDQWSWDGAMLYSAAETRDTTGNRISNTLFQQSLALDTPDAYNPFNGGDPVRLDSGDATPNPQAVIDGFRIDVTRRNRTSLALADLQLSNPSMMSFGDQDVGLGLGLEIRRETYEERRDPRLNGTVGYTDIVTGEHYLSDVMQSSITPDSSGERTVYGAFAEVAVPLVDASRGKPWMQKVDTRFALRFEDYSDVGAELSPHAGLSWQFSDTVSARAAWSQGLRAPNLPQVNIGDIPRIQVVRDWYRCQALLNKGEIPSLGACVTEAGRAVEVVTAGSEDLTAEINETRSFGLVFDLSGRIDAELTLDYWAIEQNDVVGQFRAQNHVSLDYVLRMQGGSNTFVHRAEPTADDLALFAGSGLEPVGLLEQIDDRYLNLDRRTTRGIDISATVTAESLRSGRWRLLLEATRLLESDQSVPDIGQLIEDAGEPAISVLGAGNLLELEGRPLWRAGLALDWDRGNVGAGVGARYVGRVFDSSAINDETGAYMPVDDWLSVSAYGQYRFRPSSADVEIVTTLGVSNLFDAPPPLADESLGYFVGMHDSVGRYWHLSLALAL